MEKKINYETDADRSAIFLDPANSGLFMIADVITFNEKYLVLSDAPLRPASPDIGQTVEKLKTNFDSLLDLLQSKGIDVSKIGKV